jgi:GTP-binding GTPase N-terminal/GTP-binding GTPase Middle Region
MRGSKASSGLSLLLCACAVLGAHAFTSTCSPFAQVRWQRTTSSACTVYAGKRKSSGDEDFQFYDPDPEPEPAGVAAPFTAAAVGPIFGERREDADSSIDEIDSVLLQESYGLEDIDFDELEFELDTKRYADSSSSSSMDLDEADSNGMSIGAASGRELDDVLMERSLRFYDPRVTGEREKAFLVGLELRGYGRGSKRDSYQIKSASEPTTDENDTSGADAAKKRRQDWDERFTLEESLGELSELAGTAGLEVCGSTYQRVLEPNPRTYIGTGKVKEVRRAMRELGCKTVVIDHELSPGQQRSLENEFGGEEEGIKVIDRTALILDIFAQHARTREGQLQVELALHLYRLPRLTKLWTHLERQSGAAGAGGGKSGGVGLRGPGERQLEVDRRLLKEKITDLQRALIGVRRHRTIHRRRRESLGLPIVALVGTCRALTQFILQANRDITAHIV